MNFFKKLFGISASEETSAPDERKSDKEKDFDVLKFDGVKALRLGSFDYAIECFTHALNIKQDLETMDYLSQAYLGLEEYAKSYQQLEKLAEAQPDNIAIFLRMANVAYLMADYVVMASVCEKALLIDSRSAEALFLYAKSCVGTGDSTNAVAMLTKAISVKPEFAEAYLLRGEVEMGEDNLDNADSDALYLLEKYPDNEETLMLKANIERKRNNSNLAVEYYSKVIAVNPFSQDAYRYRRDLSELIGDEAGAKSDAEHLAEIMQQQEGTDGSQDIESKVKDIYKNANPFQ